MGKILHRYIFREVLTPFVLGLGIFTFVLLIARLLKLIELVVNRGLPPGQILRLLAYLMLAFLELTVPMAMLLAILIAFGRLSADAEMIAMRSSGLSIYHAAAGDPRPDDGAHHRRSLHVRAPAGQPQSQAGAVGHRAYPGERRSQAAGVQRRVQDS